MGEGAATVNGYAQTLGRGLRVLEVLREHPAGLGVNDLSAALGLNRTVVYRLVGTLRFHHLVAQDEAGRFTLALGLLSLADGVRADLRAAAEAAVSALAEEVGATAYLTLAEGDEAVSVLVVAPRSGHMHVGYRVGSRHPLTLGAPGLAILAGRPAVVGERLEVTAARGLGHAESADELEPGAWGLAVPLAGPGGPADASVGVVAMTALGSDRVAGAVHRAADRVMTRLGGNLPAGG